tara:strand:+ start:131 stop:430 length:300 start_codon:yes stop_codon:yes gene_type:complete
MITLDLKSIYEDSLRQVEKEKAYYSKTQNQKLFFDCLNDELKIIERLKKLNIEKMIQSKRNERKILVTDWKNGNAEMKEILHDIIRNIDSTISNLTSKL